MHDVHPLSTRVNVLIHSPPSVCWFSVSSGGPRSVPVAFIVSSHTFLFLKDGSQVALIHISWQILVDVPYSWRAYQTGLFVLPAHLCKIGVQDL